MEGLNMSKKVLIISTSPRKGGNSDTLAEEFAKGAQEAGHEVESLKQQRSTQGMKNGMTTAPPEAGARHFIELKFG